MRDIWHGSGAAGNGFVGPWWTLYIVSSVLGSISAQVDSFPLALFTFLTRAAASVLLIIVMYGVARAQDDTMSFDVAEQWGS